jgi:hypothetical protein
MILDLPGTPASSPGMIHNHDLGTHLIATEKSTGILTDPT